MFIRAEHISNLLCKKVFHILIVLALLFQCKSCVSYLLFATSNFKCPICEIIKGLVQNRLAYNSGIVIYSVSAKDIIPFTTVDLNQHIQMNSKDSKNEPLVFELENHTITLKPPLLSYRGYGYTEIQNHLFIKYRQLKIVENES